MKKIICLLLAIILAVALVGCGGDKEPEEVVATGIKVTSKSARVQIGHELKLSYTLTPSTATVEKVEWSLNDNTLGTINDQGVFTAGDKGDVVVRVIATATRKDGSTITGTKAIQITLEEVVEYPDLGGYTISLAQATMALGEYDVFLPASTAKTYGYYKAADREARQKAWRDVEQAFNCTLEVREYPADAPWGGARWNYIINQARLDAPQYDLYVVPDAQIPGFVNGGALVDLTDWYDAYGQNSMNAMSKQAGTYKGHLYSINTNDLNVYNILGYNVGLWRKVNEHDSTIEEPAKMFNDGNWNTQTFVEYCGKVQNALNSLYGLDESGNPNYYCLSGWPTYYFVGMVDRNGVGVADVRNLQMHIAGDDETEVGNALRTICYELKAFDPKFNVDQSVVSWTQGKSLFNTGDLWFIGANQGRWDSDMWGEGTTEYGYVPFPAPMSVAKDTYYVGLTAEACVVMAAGREKQYASFGDECTTENIYQAYMTYLIWSKKYYQEELGYDEEAEWERRAATFSTPESQKAFLTMSKNLKAYSFYDPLTSNSNTVVATYNSAFDISIRGYVNGTGEDATWADAVGKYQDTLNENIKKAFG